MKTVTDTRTFVVVGKRPTPSAAGLLDGVAGGDEVVLLALGRQPTPAQQLLVEDALALAADRRFVLTAETVADAGTLRDRVGEAMAVRVAATRAERRRWDLRRDELSAPDR